jgi:hypothetical protein
MPLSEYQIGAVYRLSKIREQVISCRKSIALSTTEPFARESYYWISKAVIALDYDILNIVNMVSNKQWDDENIESAIKWFKGRYRL